MAFERPRRNSARLQEQRTSRAQRVSSLRPGISAPQVLTQPHPAVVEPSPIINARTSQVDYVRSRSQPIPFQLDNATTENTNCPLCQVVVTDDAKAVCCG